MALGIINIFCWPTWLSPSFLLKVQFEVSGLAVDWLGGNLYWIDEGLEAVLVTRLETKLETRHGERVRATLLSGNISLPRSLAVDPINGFLFWSNWKTSDSLESPGSIR